MNKHEPKTSVSNADAWRGFTPGLWQRDVNVRWFLQQNYTPYDGDEKFLAPATERTKGIWKKLEALFVEERKKGVLDVSPIPSSITAHAPGYIDKDNEVIIGLQTEAPLKRAIMPNGGLRMVLNSLRASTSGRRTSIIRLFLRTPFPLSRTRHPQKAAISCPTAWSWRTSASSMASSRSKL